MEKRGLRILQWTIGLLVLCNIALIATLWLRRGECAPPPQRHETPREIVIRELKMNEDQVKQYDVLIAAHQQAMKELRQRADGYRRRLFERLDDTQDGAAADSLARLIGTTQAEIEKVTYDHFVQVRALCTGGQKKAFDAIIGDITRKMNGHRPPPHDGPHDGPPGGPDGPPPGAPPPPPGPQNP